MPDPQWQNGAMADVRETKLPGVGVRHEFTTDDGTDLGVLVHHDGRREILVYDSDDPDACSSLPAPLGCATPAPCPSCSARAG